MMDYRFLVIFLFLFPSLCLGQQQADHPINPELLHNHWQAQWIAPPNVSLKEYGVYHFRKSFDYASGNQPFVIHVSADNRYKLYVNGKFVGNGPARGDKDYWRFETYDLSEYLQPGANVIAAVVWNFGSHIPYAQVTYQTGFIVQGDSDKSAVVNTDNSWKVTTNEAYKPIPTSRSNLNTFLVVGPGDSVDGSKYPWGWKTLDFDDGNWSTAISTGNGSPRGVGTDLERMLVPRQIPPMERAKQRMATVRRSSGMKLTDEVLKADESLTVPANSKVSFLIDQNHLTTAYPVVKINGGKGARVKLTYNEALYDSAGRKGNRNVIRGKTLKGYYDVFLPDGGSDRTFKPLWIRTYRYIRVDIETADQPLTLTDIYGIFTAYPFEERASFSSSKQSLEDIWDVGWRTARLCAGETYFDCPYYEQMQYVGDTRIQALISLYVSGDDRLMRKAINNFDHSRTSMGLTQSRYPTAVKQIIPPYSLFWIAMVHDYWMHREDPEFVEEKLQGIKNVLHWYEQQIDPEKDMLGAMQWWNFVDWTKEWPWNENERMGGVPKGVNEGNSSIITLQYVYALQMASRMFEHFGKSYYADKYETLANRMIAGTREHCWNANRSLIADTPEQEVFSQHANVMAVLVGMFDEVESKAVMDKVLNDSNLIQCTFYYSFYINRALQKTGMGDRYLGTLKPWYNMLDLGLTTFAEKPEPTRSDCHAWSASPTYEFLATVCGINPSSPGFKTVEIAPNLGPLTEVKGSMPHPEGKIEVKLEKAGSDGIKGTITLPEGVTGTFKWNGRRKELRGGRQDISIR